MNEITLIRMVVGILFIGYGLGFSAYEKFNEVSYSDQINGVINGFVCIIVGILVSASTINRGIVVGIVALLVWRIEQLILSKIIKNKNNQANKAD